MLKRSLNLIEDEKLLRSKITSDLTRKYVEKFGINKICNPNLINVSGKVIDHEEVCNIVESDLILLIAGRFNKDFENKLKIL